MSETRWLVGDVTGMLRTQPGRDAAFTQGGIDAYRVQAVHGDITRLRDLVTQPRAWDDRKAAVHLRRVYELQQELEQGGIFRRQPRGPVGVSLRVLDGEVDALTFERSLREGRLLGLRISEQHPHQQGGWVARFTATYAAPLPPPPPPPSLQVAVTTTAPVAATDRMVVPTSATSNLPPTPSTPSVRAPDLTGGRARPDREGCLPSLLPDFSSLGGCLSRLFSLLLQCLLGGIAILIGTFVLSGLVWGTLQRVAPGLVDALEPIRTRIPPVVGGVLGAFAAAALLWVWRQRRRGS